MYIKTVKLHRGPSRFAWLVLIPLQLALLGIVARVDSRADAVRLKTEARAEAQGPSQGPRIQSRDAVPRTYIGSASFVASTFEFGLLAFRLDLAASTPTSDTSGGVTSRPRSRAPPTLS